MFTFSMLYIYMLHSFWRLVFLFRPNFSNFFIQTLFVPMLYVFWWCLTGSLRQPTAFSLKTPLNWHYFPTKSNMRLVMACLKLFYTQCKKRYHKVDIFGVAVLKKSYKKFYTRNWNSEAASKKSLATYAISRGRIFLIECSK